MVGNLLIGKYVNTSQFTLALDSQWYNSLSSNINEIHGGVTIGFNLQLKFRLSLESINGEHHHSHNDLSPVSEAKREIK